MNRAGIHTKAVLGKKKPNHIVSQTTHRLLCPVWGRKDIDNLEQVQQRAPNPQAGQGLQPLPCQERLGKRDFVQPGEEEALGSPHSKPPAPVGRLARRWSQAQWGNGPNLKRERFRPDGRRIFSMRMVRQWGSCQRSCGLHPWRRSRPDWVKPSTTSPDPVANPGLGRRLDQRAPEGPSNLNYSAIADTNFQIRYVTFRGMLSLLEA